MALPVRKGYKGAPAQAVLTNSPTSGDTSFVVDTVTGWATTFPFYCVVDPGTSKEEKVKVTAISTLTLTVVRAQDDTTASGHNAGAAIYPVFTADEADEANLIASVMTTKGDVIGTDGSSINRLGIGTNTHVLQADSTATNGFKWGQIVEAGIADSAVTSAKIANSTIVLGDLAAALQAFLVPVGTIVAYPGATAPTGWLLCNGTSTTGYTALAALVGATTPDFQGHTLVGKSASAPFNGALLSKFGNTNTTAGHTHSVYHDHGSQDTGGDSAEHTHDINLPNTPSGGLTTVAPSAGAGIIATQYDYTQSTTSGRSAGHTHTVDILPNTVTSGDSSVAATHGNVQPSALVNYIIKHD
jgi:microcystin-dependent protein